MDILNEMTELINFLNKTSEEYEKGIPSISDKEWDEKYFQLKELEKNSGITMINSPTQHISYEIVTELKKVEHNHHMLSLDKTKNWDEFISYFGDKDVVGMVKLDGLTCSLRYINGELVSAETRGNGIIGEDILHNAKVIPSIPKVIKYKEELIVDGEVICTDSDFKEFSEEYANSRNFASGSIRLLDANECAKRHLTFVVWNIVKGFDNVDSVIDKFELADECGFDVVPWTSSFDLDAKEFLINRAKELGYPIDGLVGRFEKISYGKSLGETGHHIRGAYAFKFYDEEYETTLKDIEWTMGRTGVLTPVAVFEPIDTGDSVIERASIHNLSVAKEILGPTPWFGQKIYVAKMNMIIPQVIKADLDIPSDRDNWLYLPTKCPICGGLVTIETSDSGVENLICANSNCEGKLINRLDHFCSKKGLDIKGLSKATLEKLIDWGWVNNITDIYYLQEYKNEWINKPGFGEKSVENILTAIENSKNCELHSFITAIGIPLIGSTYAKELAKQYFDWMTFRKDVEDNYDFSNINGFGPEMSKALLTFNYDEADSLLQFIEPSNKIYSNNSSSNEEIKNIVITGKTNIYKNRGELQKAIESIGWKVSSSVSSKTNYLINNDKTSNTSKNISAKKLGVPIFTEEEFIEKFLK